MGVSEEKRDERVLKVLLGKRRFGGAVRFLEGIVEGFGDRIIDFVPAAAVPELTLKFRLNWPTGSGNYESDADIELKRKFRERRYGAETELLTARNPRRVARLWGERRAKLEAAYHRQFDSREDVALMNSLFWRKLEVEKELDDLRNCRRRTTQVRSVFRSEKGGRLIEEMWINHHLVPQLYQTAESAFGFLRVTRDPRRLLKKLKYMGYSLDSSGKRVDADNEWEDVSDLTDLRLGGEVSDPIFTIPRDAEECWPQSLEYLTHLIIKKERGELGFAELVDVVSSTALGFAGIKTGIERPNFNWIHNNVPEAVEADFRPELRRLYFQGGEERDRIMREYATKLLARWKATAVDHEKIWSWHDMSHWDKKRLVLLYELRSGRKIRNEFGEKRINLGRIPLALRVLVKDGIIKESEIDPPLKERYLLPRETIARGGGVRLLEGGGVERLALPMEREESVIDTEQSARLMLPLPESKNLPVLAGDLEGLAQIITPGEHRVLYKGDRVMMIGRVSHWPNGDPYYSEIYRVSRVRPGVGVKEGALVQICGQPVGVRSEFDREKRERLREVIYDANTPLVGANAINVVVDISPEDFRRNYLRDFVAHVVAQKHGLHVGEVEEAMEGALRVAERDGELKMTTGNEFGRTVFSTFEVAGRFGFRLQWRGDGSMMYDSTEIVFIGQKLIGFIKELGLGVHAEADLDECARNETRRKVEERIFQEQNIEAVAAKLRGNGLVNVISYLYGNRDYAFRDFGPARLPCPDCGERYIDGDIYRSDRHEQSFEGFKLSALHEIARHPVTFRNEFRNFRKIHEAVMSAGESRPPFIQFPQIMPLFLEYAMRSQEAIEVGSESYNLWESTMGGSGRYEEEDYDDDPAVKFLVDAERQIAEKARAAKGRADGAAERLQRMYEGLGGSKQEDGKIRRFWDDQVMLYNVWQLNAPLMLPGSDGSPRSGAIVKSDGPVEQGKTFDFYMMR